MTPLLKQLALSPYALRLRIDAGYLAKTKPGSHIENAGT